MLAQGFQGRDGGEGLVERAKEREIDIKVVAVLSS
jgi:hypothetical protein